MSITLSGLIVGLVMGRVLAGIISNFSSWRNVYWMAVALQSCESTLCWRLSLADGYRRIRYRVPHVPGYPR
jgi:predicted MFS family arabinose efflux permease